MDIRQIDNRFVLEEMRKWRNQARPQEIVSVYVPQSLGYQTWVELRQRSSNVVESLALWAGQYDGDAVYVAALLLPDVHAEPLRIEMMDHEHAFMGKWLRANQLRIVAELHTHMEGAFLSEVDQFYPLVAQPGFIQIVVPYFAQGTMNWNNSGMFIRQAGGWQVVSPSVLKSWEVPS